MYPEDKTKFKYNVGDIVFANCMWNVLYEDREPLTVYARYRHNDKNIYVAEVNDYEGKPALEVYEEEDLLSNKREMLMLLEKERIEWNEKIDKAVVAVIKDENIPE